MSNLPKKTTKRVKIVEEHNTYHTMESNESVVNAIATEVNNLFELEETSDVRKDAANKELEKLRQDRKEKEHNIEGLLKHNGLHRKNIELGDSYMSELIDLTYTIREAFQSVSTTIQQIKDVLSSINEIDKQVHSQNYLNKLSLRRLGMNYNKKIEDQVKKISTIENEIRGLKQFGGDTVNRLCTQSDKLKEELMKRKANVEEITEQNSLRKTEYTDLMVKLKEIKSLNGETSLDIQETNLKRDGMIADMKTFEGIYEAEMKDMTARCESLSKRVSQQNENCKKLDEELQMEKLTFASINETKNQLEKECVQISEEIKESKDKYTKLNQEKTILFESNKIEEANEQKLKEDIKEQLEKEISMKDSELQSLNQLKEMEETLNTELEMLINTINVCNENSTQVNSSIEQMREEKKMMEDTIDELKTNIKGIEIKIQQLQIEIVEYTNQSQKEEKDLEKDMQEIKEKITNAEIAFVADFETMKVDLKNELEEMDKRHECEIVDLKKSSEELQNLLDDANQSIKLLENNVDGTQSECDVISRKILILERSIREAKRQKRPVVPVRMKPSIDNMSDSSDDRPNILEIFKRKREVEMKKERAKKNRKK